MVAYSFKERFINPIRVGLGLDPFLDIHEKLVGDAEVEISPKRQTIRAIGKRRHARPGEILQLYYGMRTKWCRQIGVARCVSVEGVILKWSEWPAFMTYDVAEREPGVWRRVGNIRPILDMEEFARADGFGCFDDMAKFWLEEHGPETFEGKLIKWEPIRWGLGWQSRRNGKRGVHKLRNAPSAGRAIHCIETSPLWPPRLGSTRKAVLVSLLLAMSSILVSPERGKNFPKSQEH